MKRVYRYIYVTLLVVLVLWMVLCTHIAGVFPVKELLCRIAIPAVVFMVSALLFARFGRKVWNVLAILLSLFTLFECVVGLLQFMGKVPPNNKYWILTGNFINQGLFGGLMSLTAIVCLYEFVHLKAKLSRICAAVMGALSFSVMIVSLSRAAWVGFAVATVAFLLRETSFRFRFKNRFFAFASVFAALVLCVAAYLIKPESALARLHIWRMDCRAVMEHPLTGVGAGAELGAYGDAQEHFFTSKERTVAVKYLAGTGEAMYNEFLKLGVQGGIPALVLSVAVYFLALLSLAGKRSLSLYPLICLGVFSFFSFPFYSVTFCSLLAVFLADAAAGEREGAIVWAVAACCVALFGARYVQLRINAFKITKEYIEQPDGRVQYGKFYPEMKYRAEFVFEYAIHLYWRGFFREAVSVLDKGAPFCAHSTYFCLKGQCQESLGDFSGSISSYKKAMNMVPSRFMPYYLLINCYGRLGMEPVARLYRDKALSMPCDTTFSESMRMKKLIEQIKFPDERPE